MVWTVVAHIPAMLVMVGCFIFLVRQPSLPGIIALFAEGVVVGLGVISAILSALMTWQQISVDVYRPCTITVNWLRLAANVIFAFAFIGLAATSKRRERPTASQTNPTMQI